MIYTKSFRKLQSHPEIKARTGCGKTSYEALNSTRACYGIAASGVGVISGLLGFVQQSRGDVKTPPLADFRRRVLGLLALNDGRRVVDICKIFRVSDQPVYNWAKGWREHGWSGFGMDAKEALLLS